VPRQASEDQQRRWVESRALSEKAFEALNVGRVDEALHLFTKAHDLGDDNVLCHVRGHLGRARVEFQMGNGRTALVDVFFALAAVVVSPVRRARGVRGRGFGPENLRG
jgi:hypothetical protein